MHRRNLPIAGVFRDRQRRHQPIKRSVVAGSVVNRIYSGIFLRHAQRMAKAPVALSRLHLQNFLNERQKPPALPFG
jgi:hypothetical protein